MNMHTCATFVSEREATANVDVARQCRQEKQQDVHGVLKKALATPASAMKETPA